MRWAANGSDAVAAAPEAGVVTFPKLTTPNNPRYNSKQIPDRRRLKVQALGPDGTFTVCGQNAKALLALKRSGAAGVTALEVATWAYRFGAYVHVLRHRHGLAIEMIREPHDDLGGWHGRYRLRSAVSIVEPTP